MIRFTLALLIYASLVSAQNWEWEHYQSTFWHQAPDLPWIDAGDPYYAYSITGDFNGNGRDEIHLFGGFSVTIAEVVATGNLLDWDMMSFPVSPNLDEITYFKQAINLDEDSNDEMLVYSQLVIEPYTSFVRAYKSQSNPGFVERPDLLESLAYPGFPSPSMLGDFDGDSFLDGFTPSQNGWLHYELENDVWEYEETFDLNPFSQYALYLAADINSDGDMEVGAYEPGLDCNCMFGTIIDYANGETNVYPGLDAPLLYPGDYDGDGNTEAFVDNYELTLPSLLMRLSAGEPYNYEELANQWEANSPVVYSRVSDGANHLYSFMNGERFQWGSWAMVPAGYVLQWSDSSWTRVGDGSGFGAVYEGNTADMDADGDKEYIYRMLAADWFGPDRVVWSMGSGDLERFFDNQDTLFTNPRIGDVERDGAGELVTRVASGAPVGIYFYELERVGMEVVAHYQPHLSEGLPTNMTEFTLADIDNDGHAELFINTGYWRSYFWRNGQWEEYTGILPTGIGLNLYFADFEGDGDLDVFSQNGVWISLSPTSADQPAEAVPSSLALSAYPNPFNAQTAIQFDLPRAGNVILKLFDLLGREVETILNEPLAAGTHTHNFAATQLPSGVYFAQLESGGYRITHKLLLLK